MNQFVTLLVGGLFLGSIYSLVALGLRHGLQGHAA